MDYWALSAPRPKRSFVPTRMDNLYISPLKRGKFRGPDRSYSINLVHQLFDRETGMDRSKDFRHTWNQPWHIRQELSIFKSLTPNFTIQNVDKPFGYLRKFTQNGRLLIAFSADQRSLDIYGYRSVGAVADLLENEHNECITAADHSQQSLRIRQEAFHRLFVLRRRLRMQEGIPGGYLNREFSIFIDNSRYVLIASMGVSAELQPIDLAMYPDICTECEMFFYNFYLVDLEKEELSDLLYYKCDSIQLSLNHGVSAYNNTIAIASKYRQCIDIYEVYQGSLHKIYMIGPNGSHLREPEVQSDDGKLIGSLPLSHMKQRILTFLYRKYSSLEDRRSRRLALAKFYSLFPRYENMIIAKMQLVRSNLILIRYEQHPTSMLGVRLYVFYDIEEESLLNVFLENSVELLNVIRNHCDEFRNVKSSQTGLSPTSNSNNIYQRAIFDETVAMLDDGPQRINTLLPISTQSFITSPYLDATLFLYDDRQISPLDRPRTSTMEILRFLDRRTKQCLFRFNFESDEAHQYLNQHNSIMTRRDMVAFIFHPYEPFVISMQKLPQRYVVNFHIYNKSTNVRP